MEICALCFEGLSTDVSIDLRDTLVLEKTGNDLINMHFPFINVRNNNILAKYLRRMYPLFIRNHTMNRFA